MTSMADPYEYQKWLEQQLAFAQQVQPPGPYYDANGNYLNVSPDGTSSLPPNAPHSAATTYPVDGLGAPAGGAVGLAGGHALVNALTGGGGVPSSAAAGAAPSAPNILSAGAVPSTPNIVSAGFVPAGLPSTPQLIGAGPWWEAGVGSDAATLGSNIGSGLQSAGVGVQTAGSIGSALGTALPIAGGAYGAYSLGQNLLDDKKDPMGGAMSGAALGASIGSFFPGVGTLAGAGLGALAGGVAGSFGHGKNFFDAQKREKGIQHLIDIGFLTPTETPEGGTAGVLDLPDGNFYTIGGDEHTNTVGPDGKTLHAYDVDFSQKGVGGIVAAINPIAAYLAKGDSKLTKDFAGYFTRAALAGGDPMKNVFALYKRLGMNHDQIYGAIHLMSENGDLDKETADAYKNGLDQLYGVGAYEGKGEQFGDPNTPTTATPKPQAQAPQPVPQQAPAPQPKPAQQASPRVPLTNAPPRVPRDLLVKLGAAAGNAGTPVKLKPKTLLTARNR